MMVSLHLPGFYGEFQVDLMDRTGGAGKEREVEVEVEVGGWNAIN